MKDMDVLDVLDTRLMKNERRWNGAGGHSDKVTTSLPARVPYLPLTPRRFIDTLRLGYPIFPQIM